MKEFKKIIICGSYGAGNLGDEMILEGILTILRKDYPNSEVTVMSGNVDDTLGRHSKFKISAVPMIPSGFKSILKSWFSKSSSESNTLQKIKEADLFILGGGGLFSNLTLRSNWIWYRQVWPAIKNKVNKSKKLQIWCLSQSIDSFQSNFFKNLIRQKILKKIFLHFDKIVVRDLTSKEVLESLKLLKIKVEVQPDFATHIDLDFLKNSNSTKSTHDTNLKTIIVALRKMNKNQSKLIKETTEYLENLILTQNFQVKFINFDINKNSDHLIHEEVIKKLKSNSKIDKTKIHYIKKPKNSQEILTHFYQADYVIGMRLHSIITALITKTEFKAISYNEKVRNYLNSHSYKQV